MGVLGVCGGVDRWEGWGGGASDVSPSPGDTELCDQHQAHHQGTQESRGRGGSAAGRTWIGGGIEGAEGKSWEPRGSATDQPCDV